METRSSSKRLRKLIAHLAYEEAPEVTPKKSKPKIAEEQDLIEAQQDPGNSPPMSPTLRAAAANFTKTPTKPKTPPKPPPPSFKPPQNWREIYERLHKFRYESGRPPAAVDVIGCDQLQDRLAPPHDQRFHILVSLLLSSQVVGSMLKFYFEFF